MWSAKVINDYLAEHDANAVRYKGDFNAGTGEITGTDKTLTTVSEKKGDLYIVSTAGTYLGVVLQVGDSIIFKKAVAANVAPVVTDITFVQGTVAVVNQDATLAWGQLTKVATVEGVDISVALPSNPTAGYGTVVTKDYTDAITNDGSLNVVTGKAIKDYVDDTISQAHTHSNIDILNGFNDTSVDNWNTAYSQSHVHANAGILNGITDASIDDWMGGNVQADWNATSGDASILNRPDLGTAAYKDASDNIEAASISDEIPTSSAVASFVEGKGYTTNTGTVTSIGLSVPTGLSVSGSPVTTSGTIEVSLAEGYLIPTDSSMDDFQEAYVNMHTHDNFDILDGITDASVDQWSASYYTQGTLLELEDGTDEEGQVWDASTLSHYVGSHAVFTQVTGKTYYEVTL